MKTSYSTPFYTPSELNKEYDALRAEVKALSGLPAGARVRISSDSIQLWIDFSGEGDWVRHSRGISSARDVVRMYSRSQDPARFKLSISF